MNCIKSSLVALMAIVSLSLIPSVTRGQDPNPNIGKDAPPLNVAEWATSKTITQEEVAKGPYVLEFWATWCGPCRRTIPHLNELSQRVEPFGMKFLGLSREPIDKVKPFAANMGMVYYVGAGEKTEGLEFRGIPFAAIIGTDGKVVWAGHPASPKFEETVWQMAESFADVDLKPLVAKAKSGPLGPLYTSLGNVKGEKAEAARAAMEANLALGVKLSESGTGLKKLEALKALADLYQGVPGADAVATQMADFQKDNPELEKEIRQKESLDELQGKIGELQKEAMKIRAETSPEAANAHFQKAIVPLLEAFVKDHPDHPETEQMKKAITQLKQQAEQEKDEETDTQPEEPAETGEED